MIRKFNVNSKYAWGILMLWGTTVLFYCYQNFLRIFPSLMQGHLKTTYAITETDMGVFAGLYYVGYALGHIPYAFLLERYKTPVIYCGALGLCFLGLLPFWLADAWGWLVFGRFLIGLGSSGAVLISLKVIRIFFKERDFASFLGLTVSIGLLGAILGGRFVDGVLEVYGAETLILGLLVAPLMLVALHLASFYRTVDPAHHRALTPERPKFTPIFKSRTLYLMLIGALMIGPLEGFADFWIIPFLKSHYGVAHKTSASLQGLLFLCFSAGAFILAQFAKDRTSTVRVLFLSCLCLLLGFIPVTVIRLPDLLMHLSIAAIGFFSAYQVLVINLVSSFVNRSSAGLATAVTNMLTMGAGAVFHLLIGRLLDQGPSSAADSGTDFYWAFMPIHLCLGAAFVMLVLLRKRFRQRP